MRKYTKRILIICIVGINIIIFLWYLSLSWVSFPIKSSSHMLTLSRFSYSFPCKITLRHYVNDTRINDYILDLKTGMGVQETQSYILPCLKNGKVDVIVELNDDLNNSIITTYNQAKDLYENGLLIYFTHNSSEYFIIDGEAVYDKYVYFVSKNKKICFFKEKYSSEWELVYNAPALKKFAREQLGYFPLSCDWKKNQWEIVTQGNE